MVETFKFDEFKAKDCRLPEGLPKLCSVFDIIKDHFILSLNTCINMFNWLLPVSCPSRASWHVEAWLSLVLSI